MAMVVVGAVVAMGVQDVNVVKQIRIHLYRAGKKKGPKEFRIK
jgi:hypothetical protein